MIIEIMEKMKEQTNIKQTTQADNEGRFDAFVRQPIYDKTGREIMVGDTLKVFHFIGKRKKKHYMYKFVDAEVTFGDRKVPYLQVKHLNQRDEHYHLLLNGKKHDDIEIVQGFGDDGTHFEDRPKVA